MSGTPSGLADFEHVTLRDDETLLVRMKPDTTPEQTALMAEYLDTIGLPPGRAVIVPPTVESVTQRREAAGRVIITWPAPTPGVGILPNWGVSLHDADTGEPITAAFKLVLGTDTGYDSAPIEVEITALVDEDGEILASDKQPVRVGEPRRDQVHAFTAEQWAAIEARQENTPVELRTKVFRHAVAEMRVAES